MPGWAGWLLASGHGVHRRVHRPAAESRTSPSPGRFRVRADRARAAAAASGRGRGAIVARRAGRLLRVPGLPALLADLRRGQQPGARAGRRGRAGARRGARPGRAERQVRRADRDAVHVHVGRHAGGRPHRGAGHRGAFGRAGPRDPDGLHLRHRRRVRRPGRIRDPGARADLPARGAGGLRAGRDRAGAAPFRGGVPVGVRLGHRGRAAQRAARGRDVGSGDDMGGAGRPARRADRARHQLHGRSRPGRTAAGEPDPARGVPDVERLHPAGSYPGGAPAAADAGEGPVRDAEQRRPADVRHHADR